MSDSLRNAARTGLALAATVIAATALLTGAAAPPQDGKPTRPEIPTIDWDASSLTSTYTPPEGFYSYAPSVVRDGTTEWIWSCHNDEYRVIKDHIYLTKLVNGVVTESRSVLQASPTPAWDSFHTCDPSVVAGSFRYAGTHYDYAMFYLGNDLDASAHNQVGVAFASSPEGPWIKYPQPIVTSDRADQWGAGQPTAVTLTPGSGKVVLGFTRGDTSTRAYVSLVDLSRDAGPLVSPAVQLPTAGLTGTDGSADYLNGFDLTIDPTGQRVYVVREQHPYPLDNPWWIGPSVQVDAMTTGALLSGHGTWTPVGDIDEQLTGFTRNHNAGFVRTWDGRIPDDERLSVVFTSSCSSLPTVEDQDWSQATCDSLYSYRLWTIDAVIKRQRD